MAEHDELTRVFKEGSQTLPHTDFARYMKEKFDINTARQVFKAFQEMGLPAPVNKGEYLEGTEGALLFSNRYGLVLRIEAKDVTDSSSGWKFNRIEDSPFVGRSFRDIDTGKALIQICPGTNPPTKSSQLNMVDQELMAEGSYLMDRKDSNIGLAPIKTRDFPDGVPVLIDMLAAQRLAGNIVSIKTALSQKAEKALQKLYGPLQQAFDAAWPDKTAVPDAAKMHAFWQLCETSTKQGKLVAGWNKEQPLEAWRGDDRKFKTYIAAQVASQYDARLQDSKNTMPRQPRGTVKLN